MKGHLIHYKIRVGNYYLKRKKTLFTNRYSLTSDVEQATFFPGDNLPLTKLRFDSEVDRAYYSYHKDVLFYIEGGF